MKKGNMNKIHLVDGKYGIGDLVDLGQLRRIFERFTEATGFTIGFLDHPGLNILISTGWRDICAKFHRGCPESEAICLKSNRHLLVQLDEPGKVVIELCDHGLVDCATPIIIKGKHIASLATGQLFLEEPDFERFKRQARLFGFNEHAYLKAIEEIPVVTEEKLKIMTSLLGEIALVVSQLGYTNLVGKEEAEQMVNDIAERKRAEDMLKRSEKKFRFLTENMNDNIFTMDLNLRTTYVSQSIKKILGFTPEERLKQDPTEQVTPASMAQIGEILCQELEREQKGPRDPDRSVKFEVEYYHKDGSTVWMENVMSGIRDDQEVLVGFHGVSRDITERKQVEQALQTNETRLRTVFDSVQDFIFIKDASRRYFMINNFFKRRFDVDPSVFIGHTDEDVPIFENKEMTGAIIKDMDALVLQGETAHYELTHRVCGTLISFDILKTPIRDGQGNITGICGVSRDITERRRIEEEKGRLEDRLQHADKMESIGTLAGGIAHDFNNLLMGIQGYASLMLLDLDPSHPHYERLKLMEQMVASGADLTKQLLGFARGGRYEIKPTDMNFIIEKTSSMFGRTKKEISIHRKYGRDLFTVDVDQGQMEQVFMNLYVNAWQAMPGGGDIYLETGDVHMDEAQAFHYGIKPGKYVKITVADTGTGMDEKTRERIFDPFFTTKEMGRGTGLGLATVYGIIKGHQGIIDVCSEPGQGTTFAIHLPVSEKEVVKGKTVAGTIARGTETIILVDDEKSVLEVTKKLLESMGYRVYAAGSGQEAIAVYMEKRDKIALGILDMIMTGISGGETFDRLRKINSELKVLLSSGYSITGQAQEILDRGCNGFLQKPFNLKNLSRKLRELLD